MIILNGIGVFKDISFGTLSINRKKQESVEKYLIDDVKTELERYYRAQKIALEEISNLCEKAFESFGSKESEIFEVHKMMIKDEDYENSILNIINKEELNAEYAVWETAQKFSQLFSQMSDPYMSGRAIDVMDISERIMNCLYGKKKEIIEDKKEIIIATQDLTPSEVSSIDKNKVKGFISSEGSACSHASIIAKVLRIPSVVGLGDQILPEYDGMNVIIDSFSGTVYIDPDEATTKKFIKKKKQNDKRRELLRHLKGKENITKDGHKIDIYANINNPDELDEALENDPGGIGLFRSEFLYLNRDSYPAEEEQFKIYKSIAEKMNGKNVIIRTLDIGSDKRADYFKLPQEKNPAMGYRGIRVCLDRPDIFISQLRAIYRASAFGNISIMFPMIISLKEIIDIKKHIEFVKNSLKEQHIEFDDNVKLGIMIETPAAALISDDLAKKVDFFSIGTNDLAQYSLAVDRQNSKVNSMLESDHKSVLRMIKIVVDNAHKNGIWTGICGELAANECLTEMFLSMGVDELSMSSSFILGIRKKVTETDVGKIKEKLLKRLL